MSEPVYSVAQVAAATVDAFYARHVVWTADASGAPVPVRPAVAALVDAAFWASLRREEGRSPRLSLALVPPERVPEPLLLQRALPLAPDALARLAPAVERPGIHLGVWWVGDALGVWGATRSLPAHCLVLEVVEPGLLVLKHQRGEAFGKFGNIAVLRGDQIRVVDERSARLPDCPALLAALLGLDEPASWVHAGNELVQLAISMRGHGRGGSLLVVPDGLGAWRESIVHPVGYAVSPPFAPLAHLVEHRATHPEPDDTRQRMRRLIEGVAGLTAVDGAAIISARYEVLAFGAKIGRRDGSAAVERIVVTEPVLDDVPEIVAPTQLGGTRHLSAAQFVHDQRDALALVASQDGRFTVFAWSPAEEMVHAHRIEALLF